MTHTIIISNIIQYYEHIPIWQVLSFWLSSSSISLSKTFSLTDGLLRRWSPELLIFYRLIVIFQLLISNLSSIWSENAFIQYYFNYFKTVEASFILWYMAFSWTMWPGKSLEYKTKQEW